MLEAASRLIFAWVIVHTLGLCYRFGALGNGGHIEKKFGYFARNKDFFIAMVLLVVTLLTGSLCMVPGVAGVYHDDGIYIATAKSLASGHGYRLINLPGAPLQTKYPPLYPVLLAFIWKLWPAFPDNLLAMQWLTLLMSGLSVSLCYYYAAKYGYFSRPVALAAALFCATSHFVLYYSTLPLSEMPFACLLCLALFSLDNFLRTRSPTPVATFFLILLLTVPFLTRTIGVALIPVALIVLFLRHRLSWSLGVGSGLIVSAWLVWAAIQPKPLDPFAVYYTSYASWWLQLIGIKNELRVVALNFLYLLNSVGSLGTTVIPRLASFEPTLGWLTIPFGASSLVGIYLGVRNWQILPCFLSAYLLIVILWPWPPSRFVIPILIFLLGYSLNWIWNLMATGRGLRAKKGMAALICAILLIGNVWETCRVAQFNRRMHYPSLIAASETPVAWSSFSNIFSWIKANTRPTDVIASPLDSMVFLYTGRVAFRPFAMRPTSLFYGDSTPPATVEQLLTGLKVYQAHYLVQTPMLHFNEEKPSFLLIEEIRRQYPGYLNLVYVGEDSRFMIFKVQP